MVSPSSTLPKAEVLSSLLLDAPAPTAQPRILQRSADGQFLALTSRSIYIYTHQPGFIASGAVGAGGPPRYSYMSAWSEKATTNVDKQAEDAVPEPNAFPCYTTKITIPPADELLDWTEHSRDDRNINLGAQYHANEVQWRAACWSPSGVSSLGGCVMAVLNSNHEIDIYGAGKDPLTGEWKRIDSVTERLLEVTDFSEDHQQTRRELSSWEGDDQWHLQRVLDCQTLCMSWSPQVIGGKLTGRSLLALGHKAGTITFWSIGANQKMTFLHKLHLGNRWISSVAFGEWTSTSASTASVPLAYTTPTGAITVLEVSIDASDPSSVAVDDGTLIHPADNRPLTSLEWSPADKKMLAYSHPGKVTLWSPSVEEGKRGWEGERSVLFATAGDWVGCSKLSACAGINSYTPTSLAFTLSDGTIHIIDDLDKAQPRYDLAVSKYLSDSARGAFEAVESSRTKLTLARTVLAETTQRTSGSCYLGRGIWAWIYQPVTFHDIGYLIPSAQTSTIIVADIPTHSQPQRATQLKDIREALDGVDSNVEASSAAVISPFVVAFSSTSPAAAASFQLLSPHLLRTIRQLPSTDSDQPSPTADEDVPESLEDVKSWFRRGLREELWEKGSLAKLRVRYALARYLSTVDGPQKEEFTQQSEVLARLIVTQSLGIILDWANRAKEFISEPDDLHYLTLLIHALLSLYLRPSLPSSPPPSPADLATLSTLAGAAFDLALHFEPQLAIAVDPEELEELISLATIRQPPPPQIPMEENGEQSGAPSEEGWLAARKKLSGWLGEGGGEVVEACPGCEEEVKFADLEIGVCREEHVFDRCSLTLVEISAPQSRRCLSCARLALVPPSMPLKRKARTKAEVKREEVQADEEMDVEMEEQEPPMMELAERSKEWLREAVLEVGKLCIYCGGRFGLSM